MGNELMDLMDRFILSNDEDAFIEIIKKFEFKIKKSTYLTTLQERQDLEQELKIKILEKIKGLHNTPILGFWDFIQNITEDS